MNLELGLETLAFEASKEKKGRNKNEKGATTTVRQSIIIFRETF